LEGTACLEGSQGEATGGFFREITHFCSMLLQSSKFNLQMCMSSIKKQHQSNERKI